MAKKSSSSTEGIGMATGLAAPYRPSPQQIKAEQQYRAEDDLRTLHRAHQIVTDKPRHAAVKALAKQQATAVERFGKKR